MLDPHVTTIEAWLAAEPQLTALAIVGRLSKSYPEQFCKKVSVCCGLRPFRLDGG